MKWWRMVVCVAGLLAFPGGGEVASAVTSRPDLSGAWRLNRELSEFPREVAFLSDWLDAGGTGTDGRGGGGRRGGGGGGNAKNRPPMSQPESEEDSLKVDQLMGEVKEPSPVLTIVQNEAAVAITDAHGVARTFHTSGKEDIQQLDAGPMATTCRWDGGNLVIEYRVAKGRQLRYTYARVAARSHMQVQVQLLEKAKSAPIVRIYDAEAPNAK